jgi:hypothetical protein
LFKDVKLAKLFDGIVIGVLGSTALCLFTLWVFDALHGERQQAAIAIMTTTATLAAGYMALSAAQRSISAQADSFIDARNGKLEAAKSLLPLVLSQIIHDGDSHIQGLINGPITEPKRLDANALTTIKECIEASHGVTRTTLQEILAIYQICLARHEQVRDFNPIMMNSNEYETHEIFRRVIDWCALMSLAETLFDFARGRSKSPVRTDAVGYAKRRLTWLADRDSGVLLSSHPALSELYDLINEGANLSFAQSDWLKKP